MIFGIPTLGDLHVHQAALPKGWQPQSTCFGHCSTACCAVQGNPLCLRAGYTTAVQQQLSNLQHFDGNPVMWQPSNHKPSPVGSASTANSLTSPTAPRPRSALKHSRGALAAPKTSLSSSLAQAAPVDKTEPASQCTESDSIAALHSPASPSSPQHVDCSDVPLQLQVQLTQLTVGSATSTESIPAADSAATEGAPPLYRYFLQLR